MDDRNNDLVPVPESEPYTPSTMPQEEKKPVQITITAAGDHADRATVHDVVSALTTALDQSEIAESVTATIVTKIKKG